MKNRPLSFLLLPAVFLAVLFATGCQPSDWHDAALTPEQVAEDERSYTGQYLKKILK